MAHSIASLESEFSFLSAYAVPAAAAVMDGAGIAVRDVEHSGPYRVQGTVKRDDTPTDVPMRRQVVLLVQPSMLPIREVWSDATTGAYDFPNLTNRYKYSVIAFDYEHNYRAVIADNLTPEAM